MPTASGPVKQRTAALSIVSNSGLILLKVIAGTITGSVAILTEAVHSSIDLIASIVAFFSVRRPTSRQTSRTATATRRSRTWLLRSRAS